MKKILMVLGILFLFVGIAQAKDFRNVDWGMSIDEVKKLENDADFVKKETTDSFITLSYTTKLFKQTSNKTVNLKYYFTLKGKLISANYNLTSKPATISVLFDEAKMD